MELWTSIASTIARRAELNRVTTYTLLEDLKKDGIVNETTKDGVKYYSVIRPDILLKQLEQKYESFKDKVPELLAIAEKFGNKPKIQYFEWFEGLKKMYNDQLTSKTEFLVFMWREGINKQVSDYLLNIFVPQRVKSGISVKVILSDSEENRIYNKKSDKLLLKESFIIDDVDFHLPNEIILYDNKVSISMYTNEDMSWIIIHSTKLYETMKNIFNMLRKTKNGKKSK